MLLAISCNNGIFSNPNTSNNASSISNLTLDSNNFYGYGSLYNSFADGSNKIILEAGTLSVSPSVFVSVSSPTNINPDTLIPGSFSCDTCTIGAVKPVYESGVLVGFTVDVSSNNPGEAIVTLTGVETMDGISVEGSIPVTFVDNTPALSLREIPTEPKALEEYTTLLSKNIVIVDIEIPLDFVPAFVLDPLDINAVNQYFTYENCTILSVGNSSSTQYNFKVQAIDTSLPVKVSLNQGSFSKDKAPIGVSNTLNIDFSQAPIKAKYYFSSSNNITDLLQNYVSSSTESNVFSIGSEFFIMLQFSGSSSKTVWTVNDFTCLGNGDNLSQIKYIAYQDAKTVIVALTVDDPSNTLFNFSLKNIPQITGLNNTLPVTLEIDKSSSISLDTSIVLLKNKIKKK
jgi:hypothetical protein